MSSNKTNIQKQLDRNNWERRHAIAMRAYQKEKEEKARQKAQNEISNPTVTIRNGGRRTYKKSKRSRRTRSKHSRKN